MGLSQRGKGILRAVGLPTALTVLALAGIVGAILDYSTSKTDELALSRQTQRVRIAVAFDEVRHGGKWDWSLGGEAERAPLKFALAYVGSNADAGGRHALVGALSFSW
jgi:hypothetical protein